MVRVKGFSFLEMDFYLYGFYLRVWISKSMVSLNLYLSTLILFVCLLFECPRSDRGQITLTWRSNRLSWSASMKILFFQNWSICSLLPCHYLDYSPLCWWMCLCLCRWFSQKFKLDNLSGFWGILNNLPSTGYLSEMDRNFKALCH